MITLRRLLLRRQVLPLAAALAAGVGLVWVEASRQAWKQADVRVASDLGHMRRALACRLRVEEDLAESLGALWASGQLDPSDGAKAWARVEPVVRPHAERLTGVNLVAADGRGFGMGSGPSGWVGWTVVPKGSGFSVGRILGTPETPSGQEAPDMRQRPWYRVAQAAAGGHWTEPFTFVAPWAGRPGISYARPVRDGQGRLLGCVAVHLLLGELDRLVAEIRPTPGAQALVTDGAGRPVVVPSSPDPALLPLAAELLRRRPGQDQPSALLSARLSEHFGRGRAFGRERGPDWFLVLVLPDSDVATDPARRALVAGGVALGLLALHFWHSLRLARRVANPLARLAQAAEALPKAERLELPAATIQELDSLRTALLDAHAGVRERDRLQDQLRQAQKLETVGTLAGGIAHDVNNQLTAILGQLDIGRELLEPHHPALPHLGLAWDAARRSARTAKALLSFSRPSPPELAPLNLNEVVHETELLLNRVLGPGVCLETELREGLPLVMGDRVQLEQVLVNLVMNARDALPEGGCIRVTTQASPLGVDLVVEDEGVGMSPEVKARIFEPFFTTKEPGRGTGLGLSMALGIVRAHGGDIRVDSRPGEGTRFRVRLQVAEGTTEPPPGEAPVAAGPTRLDGLRILVADDEGLILHTLSRALADRGARVVEAQDGEEAWRRFQLEPFDAVVSDHLMPRCTGLELLDRIRERHPDLPVVLASGRYPEGVGRRLAEDPRLRLLAKPFALGKLSRTLAELAG